MPALTDIKETKKGRYALFCDGAFLFSVDDETFVKSGIARGDELTDEIIAELRASSDYQKAKDKAFSLLALRDHTQKELYDKLRRSFDDDTSREAVAVLERLGYLDDQKTARALVAEAVGRRAMSVRRTREYIRQRGIDGELADELLSEYEDSDALTRVIEKKYKNGVGDPKKAFAALMRLGFEAGDIRRALGDYMEEQ